MKGNPAKQLRLFQELDRPTFPIIETTNGLERQRIEEKFAPLMREELKLGQLVSYVGNKTIPVLRLYRYKEAFAFRFVKEFIDRFGLTSEDYLFDPFCGMGTTLFTAMQNDVPAIGIDRLPIATFVAQTLPLFFSAEPQALRETFESLGARVAETEPAEVAIDVRIMKIAFPEETLLALRRWKGVIDTVSSPMRDIFLLLFFAILEPCSYTAKDGQFLRLKRNKRITDPTEMLQQKVYEAEKDILSLRRLWGERAVITSHRSVG